MAKPKSIVPIERIEKLIYLIRGQKVILDGDLAELYGVETGALNRAVKRNIQRFPKDFMFQITDEEAERLRCQTGISKSGRGGRRYLPYAFTEQGVAMLSSVLNSDRAIQVNILIMRAFTRLRQMLSTHEELRRKIEAMERKYDRQFRVVFEAIKQLIDTNDKPKRKIYPVEFKLALWLRESCRDEMAI
jgi:hypothetical protein